MPEDFEPKSVVPSNEFTMQGNPDAVLGQANETFLLTAENGNVLGRGGETKGFAKYQFGPNPQLALDIAAIEKRTSLSGQHPEAARYEIVSLQMANQEGNIAQAKAKVKSTENLPQDDPARLNAEADLARWEDLGRKNEQEFLVLAQKPAVKSYLLDKNERLALLAKVEQINSASYSTSDLFWEDPALKLKITQKLGANPGQGGDRSMLSRAVGSTVVDNFLGTGCVAEEKFGVDKNGRPVGVSVQVDGAGVSGMYQGKEAALQVDYSDPEIQRGLSNLEVNDYITGQLDRHTGNIFIDPVTKKVTGIDNDLAFPDYDREKAVQSQTGAGKALAGLPKTMHKDTAERIAKLDPEALRRQLRDMPAPDGVGTLSEASINGAVDRLKKIQGAINSGDIKVVTQFDKQTYKDALDKQNAEVEKNCAGKKLNQLAGEDDVHGLSLSLPTSYLGAALVKQKRYELGSQLEPHKFSAGRPANSAGKATRDPNYAEYEKMAGPLRQNLRNEVAKELKPQSDQLNTSLDKYTKRLESLESPGLLGTLRSLRYGGPQGARDAFNKKKENTLDEVHNLEKRIDNEAEKRLEPLKKDLHKQAGETVSKQQQGQGNVQDLALSNKEAQQLLKALDKLSGPSKDLALTENEATELLNNLNKLNTSRQSLSLNQQEANELRQALDNLSPERLQQVSQQSKTVKVTNEQLEKMIQELKDLDLDDPSQGQKQSTNSNEVDDEKLTKALNDLQTMDGNEVEQDHEDLSVRSVLHKGNSDSSPQSLKTGQKHTPGKHSTGDDVPEAKEHLGHKTPSPTHGAHVGK